MAKASYELHIEHDTGDDSTLVLLKFPAMRSQFENPADQLELSCKPKSMKLKLALDLDPQCNSFSRERAAALASKSVPKTFQNNLVTKNFYTSTKTPLDESQLFACKVVNDKLVCRPISHLLTMRSDFTHLDLIEEVDSKEEVKPVSVKFAAPDRQATSSASKTSGAQQEEDEFLDEYKPLKYRTISSKEAGSQRVTLFGQQMPKMKPDPDAAPVDKKPTIHFMPDIKPKIEKMDVDDIYSSDMAQSSSKIANSIKQRVRECLFKAKIVSFEELFNFIRVQESKTESIHISSKDILDALSELALLVQGNWAIKSEILHGDSSERDCTDVTGISISLFTAARDYLLWLFTQNRLVSRLEYTNRVKMPDHDVLELFNQLAIFREDQRKWELKLATDNKFLSKFPDIVQRQATFWKVRKANKLSMFGA